MNFRQNDQNALAPKRHRLAVCEWRFAGHNRKVYDTVAQSGNETRSRTFDHNEANVGKSLRVLNQRGAQISSRK